MEWSSTGSQSGGGNSTPGPMAETGHGYISTTDISVDTVCTASVAETRNRPESLPFRLLPNSCTVWLAPATGP